MTAESIARELHGRRSGAGWVCRCPAHEDRSPSLSIREVDGKVLVHCFTGCPQENVIEALRSRGLWPERERREWTPAERQEWGRRRRAAERLADEAACWLRIRLGELESEKRAAFEADDLERLGPAAHELYSLQSGGAAGVIAAYRAALASDPIGTAAMVRIGREVGAACERIARLVVQGPQARGEAA